MNNEGLAEEVSEENKGGIKHWARGDLCYILAKITVTFCPHPKNLREIEIKTMG